MTYSRDIAPIVYQNCASCHYPGEVAPFPLMSYDDVKQHARQIALVTQSRYMPPWHADSHGEFANERRLSATQIAMLAQWAKEGMPKGDPAALPPAPHFTSGWTLGPPDAVFTPAQSYTLAAEGDDVYRCFVIPTHFAQDRFVTAMEVRPGNHKVVHHVIAFLDTSGRARQLEAQVQDHNPGYTSFGGVGFLPSGALGGWAPGMQPAPLPDGVGTRLPKGADIVLQVHYHKSGKPETDLTKLGLYFCKKPVDKQVRVLTLVNLPLRIPPGDADYVVHAGMPVRHNITVLQIVPHMHLLGRSMMVTAALPDGAQQPLVNVPNWDFNWQTLYTYKQPVKLPQGSRISLVAHYDNSTDNPRNPTIPPKWVTWGEQTTDEMCIAFVLYTVEDEHLTQGIAADEFGNIGGGIDPAAKWAELMQQVADMFDTNGDGKLDAQESAAMWKFFGKQLAAKPPQTASAQPAPK